jgi:plastocyanin
MEIVMQIINKNYFRTPFIVLIISIMLLCYHSAIAYAQESAPHVGIITIKDRPETIVPDSLSVKKGDTIVWYNQGKEPISIRLVPQLGIVCSPIVNFYSDLSGNYKTGSIYHGGTASLCLLYTGVYAYEVKWIDEKKKTASGKMLSGKVIVTE